MKLLFGVNFFILIVNFNKINPNSYNLQTYYLQWFVGCIILPYFKYCEILKLFQEIILIRIKCRLGWILGVDLEWNL